MKKTPLFVACAIGLTLVFYMAAYYLLPGDPPSAAMMGLFAALALSIVWAGSAWRGRSKELVKASPATPPTETPQKVLLWIALTAAVAISGCSSAPPPAKSANSTSTPSPGNRSPASLDRVTGTAVLLAGKKEPAGYGLYSYALLFHPPSAAELPRYQAFLKALVDLPTAEGLTHYISPDRINVTSIPLTQADQGWANDEADAKVAFILKHYDYARSAAIRASLASRIGAGPVLLSVLHPIDLAARPSPVLVQDMSLAQASLMSAYVQSFVSQAAQERFWQASELSQFALGLRNSLETAAAGLNLSQTAVDGWIKFFK